MHVQTYILTHFTYLHTHHDVCVHIQVVFFVSHVLSPKIGNLNKK